MNSTIQSQYFIKGAEGELEINKYESNSKDKDILVVPNGYGSLKYCETLGGLLSSEYSNVMIPNLRGQGMSDGELTLDGGGVDLSSVIQSQDSEDITVISHCSSIYYFIEQYNNSEMFNKISKIILYGYLAHPERHLQRFSKKAKKYNVNFNVTKRDLTKYKISDYEKIKDILYIVHPLVGINLSRANQDELGEIEQVLGENRVFTPAIAYEIADLKQQDKIAYICDNYFRAIIDN